MTCSFGFEEMNRAIDATKTTAVLQEVLTANGEEHLYDTIMQLSVHVEEDPIVIFGWQNVQNFVEAIHKAQAQAVAPGGLPLPANPLALPAVVNVQIFKEAVLEYVRMHGALARLDTTCLRCSLAQCVQVGYMLQMLDMNPWIQRIIEIGGPNAVPIASVYVPRAHSNILDRSTPQLSNSLWG